jgi:hypothetical protein
MAQIKLLDIQSTFIIYLHHQGKGRAEAARLADPRQSAFTLTQSPRIIEKIRQERNKAY